MKKSNSVVKWLAAFVALAVVLGCGGGGGGASTTGSTTGGGTGTTGAPPAGQYLEFSKNGTIIDPLNLLVGETVLAQYVNYDSFGTRTPLAVSSWSLSGSGAGTAVTITGSGILTVSSMPPGYVEVSGTAQVIGQPKTLMRDIRVAPSTNTRVTGRLVGNNSTIGVASVQLEFIDNGGNVVGAALSNGTGNFTATVGNNVAFLRLKPATVPIAYFAAIKYLNVDYAITGTSCLLPTPTVTPGGTVAFPATIFIPRQQDGPPPPPTGCGP